MHPPHRLASVIADGHGAAQQVAVDVVEAAVHAGGHPSTPLRTGPLAVGGQAKAKPLKERGAFGGFNALGGSVALLYHMDDLGLGGVRHSQEVYSPPSVFTVMSLSDKPTPID